MFNFIHSLAPETNYMLFILNLIGELKIVQYIAPLQWLSLQHLEMLGKSNKLESLEMLILANTSSDPMSNMNENCLRYLLQEYKSLSILGSLKTWVGLDYFNPGSDLYFREEADAQQIKKEAKKKNWDIDFDMENLDFLYELS